MEEGEIGKRESLGCWEFYKGTDERDGTFLGKEKEK